MINIQRAALFFIPLVALLITLAGCMPADPYTARALADGAIQASAVAARERIEAATLAAGVLQAQTNATAQAWAWQSTATQSTYQAIQTSAASTALAVQASAAVEAARVATQTAYPPQATATQAAVNVHATQTQAALNEVVRLDQKRERDARLAAWMEPIKNILYAALWIIVLTLIVVGAVAAYRRLMPVLELRLRSIQRGPHDAPLVLFSLPGGRLLIWDSDRNAAPGAVISTIGAAVTGLAPELGMQMRVTSQDQAVDLVRGLPREPRQQKTAKELAVNLLTPPIDPPPAQALPQLPESASWQTVASWAGGPLPLGLGTDGLVLADPESHPHFLFAGKSGSGKSRAGLRPLAALALAGNWAVSIFDNSKLDFLPFENHPNARVVKLSVPEDAIGYLQALYQLVRQRQDALAAARISTWGRLPGAGPRVLGIFDEFSNLADALSSSDREELWKAARMVAAEGRKAGVHLAIALQDPTHRSLDLRIRRNMTPVCFAVQDADASRVVLNASGAEALPKKHFLTNLGQPDLVRGVGFMPDDPDISQFLSSRPVTVLPDPTWLKLPPSVEPTPNQDASLTVHQMEQARSMRSEGKSINEIQDDLFGYRGGHAYRMVKQALGDT